MFNVPASSWGGSTKLVRAKTAQRQYDYRNLQKSPHDQMDRQDILEQAKQIVLDSYKLNNAKQLSSKQGKRQINFK